MRQFLRLARPTFLSSILLTVTPAAVFAQASITGVVRDTSGAVLPGATVEAESPALIERVRSGVTDGTGRFRIEELRPGTYTVTFTLPGFATLRREGIELTGTFVATVNADLPVATVAETVTVTGEAPVVDVQSAVRQRVLDAALVDTIPMGRTPMAMATVVPGVTRSVVDVGGIGGDGSSRGNVIVRGVDDTSVLIGNASMKTLGGSGGNAGGSVTNMGAYQEMVVDTGGQGVQGSSAGTRMSLVPRDGGNTFSARLYTDFANSTMQGDNFTQDLRDRGLRTPNSLNKLWDVNPGFGGPILRDRFWFHWSMRHAGAFQNVPMFFSKNAGDPTKWTYEPDLSRQVVDKNTVRNWSTLRLTWQATPRNKLGLLYDSSSILDLPRNSSPSISPEANMGAYVNLTPRSHVVGDWTTPVTNRSLLQATFVSFRTFTGRPDHNLLFPAAAVPLIQVQEQSTGLSYRATATTQSATQNMLSGSVLWSYITGAHAFKVGFDYGSGGFDELNGSPDAPLLFRFNNGVPNRITLNATPYHRLIDTVIQGLWGQDRWTVDRLTLTLGLRYEYADIWFPETHVGPAQFAPNRNIVFPRTDGMKWRDLTGTSNVAVDLFGDGKTALKFSLGKYLPELGLARSNVVAGLAPVSRLVNSTTRSWTDANRDFVPDCALTNPAANGECGAMADPNFGSTRSGQAIDPALVSGWGTRPDSHWQFSAGVQRELLPRVSVDLEYWRTWYGNFVVIDDRAVGPSDYDAFSITAPVDPRLPNGGGYVIGGLYDLKPTSFGRPAQTLITSASNFGKQINHWNGVDITLNARPRGGITLQGGTSTQRQTTDNCDVVTKVNSPSPLYCHAQGRFQTQVKFLASYTVPRIDLQVTGNLQNLSGPQIAANYTATNAIIAPSLGRNLSGGASNVTVNLIEPGTLYGERLNMLDLRFGKILRFGRNRATAHLDLYNVSNANTVLTQNNTFGAVWQQPQSILPARFAKVGLTLEF
jgi:hypothetical protein